jgi:hypothetical protein
VLNEDYAIRIARDWNVSASGVGYVTRFEVDAAFAARYPVQQAGGRTITASRPAPRLGGALTTSPNRRFSFRLPADSDTPSATR